MKKLFIIIGIIICLPFVGFGIYAFDLYYYEAKGEEAEKAARLYLEDKYREKFTMGKAKYSKALGDDFGWYSIVANPLKNKEINIHLLVSEDYKIEQENYKHMKWRNDVIKEYRPIIEPYFPNYEYMYVNPSFPEGVTEPYGLDETYQTILKKHPNIGTEFLHILVFENPESLNIETESKKHYQLSQVLQKRAIKEFTVEVEYFPAHLLEAYRNVKEGETFKGPYWKEQLMICRYSSNEIKEISSDKDFAAFCRKLK